MQKPQTEIFEVCKPLLQGTPAEQKSIIDKVFTDDAVFRHPFIVANGKRSILKTYQMWGLINKQIGFGIERAVISEEGDLLVLVDFNSHEYPWFWPFDFPIIKLHYDIKLKITDTPEGKKFTSQDDHFRLTETFMELPGMRYISTTSGLQEIWGWILTQFMTFALSIFAADEAQLKKIQ